jgi:uncharacterized protein DUF5671
MSAQLDSFVRECLGRGIPRATIRAKLAEAGWASEEVEAALAQYAEVEFEIPVPKRRAYLSARETFFYLVLFATLYTSAINAGAILFLLIERLFPDRQWAPETLIGAAARARGATAALVIAFPVFLLTSRTIGQMLAREPVKRGSPIRKWLTYLTLFVAAMVLVGNLIVLVAGLLSGEITTRFALKVLVVFLIAGTVFAHYAGDLRREEQAMPLPARRTGPLARIAAVAVCAVMVAGFFAAGSPREARLRKLDLDRLNALQQIDRGLRVYHMRRGALPDSLDPLLKEPDTFVADALVDPVTQNRYEYRVLDQATGSYELCAVFQLADSTGGRGTHVTPSELWKHGVGRHCFAITIGANRLDKPAPRP